MTKGWEPPAAARWSEHRVAAPVFADANSLAVLAQAEQVAATDASVLVIGQTGTGKEVLARHVHEHSGRRGPFVAVNCGALSEHLIDAELFGHEAGAYTGAGQARAGWFEAAQHGSLFLDEIGDLSLPLQVKLLRVLQERQVVRLGSRKPIDIDVRLIAATNVDLVEAVEAGRFRRDLYYRLNIATLQLPRLAERPRDILALADHFMAKYGHRLQAHRPRLSTQARAALLAHPWPGNIRELENVIHYALIVADGPEIRLEDLNLSRALVPTPSPEADASPAASAEATGMDLLRRALRGLFESGSTGIYARIERDTVQAAYEFCQRNQVHTAELLGISRNVLRSQLKRFGFLPDRALSTADVPSDLGAIVGLHHGGPPGPLDDDVDLDPLAA